jgi:Holliday junction resolvase RusA-like endonuclease
MVLKLSIPGIPPSLNKWRNMHHHQEAKEKKHWENAVIYEVIKNKLKPRTPMQKALVTYIYYFPTRHRHDPDNYTGKWLMDGLVKSGILQDDSFDNVEINITMGGVDKHKPRVEIEVQEV